MKNAKIKSGGTKKNQHYRSGPYTYSPSAKKNTEPEEKTDNISSSWWQRIKNSSFVTKASSLLTKAGSKWEKFEETKPGKVFTVTTGIAVSRVVSIVLASLTIAGLVSPVGPGLAIAIGVIGLTTVAVGIAMDTARTRATRQLQKENRLLVKNRTARSTQEQILKLEPSLNQILEGELYQPLTSGKKSIKERYIATPSDKSAKLKIAEGVGKAFLQHSLRIFPIILEAVVTSGATLLRSLGFFALSVATDSRHNISISTVQNQLKTQIDSERNKSDTPGYNNFTDLKQATRSQRIQTMALQKLITDEQYWTMSPDQKIAKFKEIKEDIAKTEKAVRIPKNIFTKGAKLFTSVLKDMRRTHNPFSEYNAPSKIKIKKHSGLTKAIEAQAKKELLISSVQDVKKTLNKNPSKQNGTEEELPLPRLPAQKPPSNRHR